MKTTTILGVVLACVLISSAGCQTIVKAVRAGEPLPNWEKTLVNEYTELDDPKAKPPKLKFIADYNKKYESLYPTSGSSTLDFGLLAKKTELAKLQRETLTLDEESYNQDIEKMEVKRLTKVVERESLMTDVKNMTKITALDAEIAKLASDILVLRQSALAAHRTNITARITTLNADINNKEQPSDALENLLEQARIDRNRIVSDLMIIAKKVHDEKDNYLHYFRAGGNVVLDSVQLLATGLASVVGSESTARALAVLSTGTKGFQESADAKLFYQHATPVILSIMHKQRIDKETILVNNMSKSVIDYPLNQALAEFADYLVAGGLTDALSELGAEAKQKELRASQALDALRQMSDEARTLRQKEAEEEQARNAQRNLQMQRLQEAWINTLFPPAAVLPKP